MSFYQFVLKFTYSFTIETAMKKFSSYKNEEVVPDNQILNVFSEEKKSVQNLFSRFVSY
ncbi:hypothetical protein [Flavobacterium sp. ZT3R18]|uniref:hypothetical protein n=1 Tax=Flavobacterium sp. ZT3R18 TaxID=2594429 RepID=UPI00163DD2E3|nr:hypothetical protein [Flavobacterium sp. ZT3R18]